MGEDSEQVEKRLVESFFFKTVGSVQVCSEFKSTAVNRLLVVAGDSGFTLWADGCEVNWSRTCDLVQRARSQQEESKKCWETIKPSASSLVTVLSLSPGEKFLAICREDGMLDIHSLADIVSNGEGSTLHFSTTLQSSPKSFSWQGEEFVCLLEGGDVRRGTVGALESAPICVDSIAFGACSTELWATATASSPNVLNILKGEQSTTVAIEKDGKEYRDMMINTIHWVNAQTILVACTVPHGNDLGLLHLVTLKEGDLGPDTVELIFVDFLTIEVAEFGKEMGPHLHTSAIEDWGLTFVAHGKARDMHFRTVGAPNGSPPFLLDTHPDGELSVPLTEDYDDNYVVGVGMDFTSEEVPVQWKAGDLLKDIDPCPLMVSATTDGHIRFTTCGWESAPYSLVHPPKVLGRVSEEETPQKNAEEDVEEDDTLPDAPAVSTFPQGSPADGTPTTSEKDFPPPPENDQEEEAADGTPSPATSLSLKQSEDEKEGKSEGSGTVGAFDTPSSSSFSLQPSSTPHTAGQTGGGFGTFNESTIGSSPIVTVPWGTPPSIVTNLGTPSGSKKGAFESLAGGSSGLFQTPVRDPSMWDNTSLNSGGNRPKSPEEPGSAMSGYGEMWNPTPALEGNQEKSTFGQLSGGELFGSHKEGSTGGAISDSLKKSLEAGISPPRADPRIGKGPSQKDNSSDFCRHESGWEGFSTQEREEEEEDEYETEEEGSPSFGDADNELQDVDSPTITNGTPRIPDSGQTQRRRVSSEEGSSPGAAERPFSPSNINDPGEGRVPPGLFPKAQKDTPIPTRERFGPPGLLPSAQEDPSTPPRGRNLGLADVGDEKNGEEEDPNFTGEQKSWKNPYFDSSSVPSSPGGLVGRRPFAPPLTPGIPENPDTMQAAHSPASEMQYRNELVYPPGLGFGDSQAPPSSSPIVGADVDRNWRDSDSPEQGLESDGIQRLIQGKEEEEDKSTTSTVSEKNANGELERLVESVSLPDGQGEAREGEEEVVEEETEPEPDRNLMVEIRQALELSRRKLAEHDEEWKRLQALYQILRDTKKRAAIMKEKCDELEHRLSCKQADAEIKSRVERVKETYRRVNSAVGTLGILQSFFKGNKSCNHTYATRQGQSAYYAVTEVIQEINAAGNSLHVRVEKLRAQQQKHRQIVQQRTPEDSNPMKLRTPWASMSPADRKHLVEEIKKRQPTISYAPGVAPRRRTQPDNDAGWTLAVSSEPAKTSPPPLPPKRLSIPGLTVPKRGASEQKSNRTPGPSMSREQGAKRPPPVDDGGAQDNSFGGPPGIVPGISMSTSQTFKAASQGSGGSPGNLNQNNVTTKAPAAVKASPSGGGFTAPSAKPSSISTSSAPAKRPAPSSSSEGFSAPSVQQNTPPQNSIFGSMSQLSMSDPSTVPTSKPAVPTQPSMGSVFGTGGSSPSPATPSSAPAPGPKSGQTAAFEVPKSSPSPVPFGSSASLSPNSGVGGPSPTPQSPPPGQGVFSGFSKQVTAKTSGNAFATNSLQVAGSGDSGGASPLGPFAQSPTAANPTGVPGFGAPGSPQPPNLGVSFGNTAVLGAGGVASQLGSLQAAASQPQQGINGGGGFGRYVAAGSGFGGLASGGGTGFGNLSSGGGTGFGNQSGGGVGFGNPSSGGGGFSNFASGGSAFGAVGATGGSGFGGLGAGPGFGGAGNSGFGQSGSGSGGDNKQNQGAMWQPRR